MRQLTCIICSIALVFLVYIHRLLNNMIPDYRYSNITKLRPPHPSHYTTQDKVGMRFGSPKCNNLFTNLLQGQWRLKEDIKFTEFIDHRRTDMQMRLKKGWPPLLYHGDLRCGTKYPLPRIMRTKKTEGYYLDIPSQCDLLSESPCCRDDIGWCGNGQSFCECTSCMDYRKYIPAEFAVWEVASGCVIKNINTNEACSYLNQYFTSITFIGDSLVRHVFSSLLILLTNNKNNGALRADLNPIDKEICAEENQFVDSACHTKLAMNWKDVQKQSEYCSNTTNRNKPRFSFVEAYNIRKVNLAKTELKQRLQEKRPLVVMGIGVHDNFNYKSVIKEYLSPILELRNTTNWSKGTFIWLNTHSSGPLKPNEFRKLQGNKRIQIFNKQMNQYCENNGILTVDTFNFTKGIHSFDGTHYGYEINRLKVQILLNGLKELFVGQ